MSRRKSNQTDANERVEAQLVDPKLVEAWRERAGQVPEDVADQLGRMRRAAVAELDQPSPWRRRILLLGTCAGTAAALVLTLALLVPGGGGPDVPMLADPDEIAAVEDLEILEELEFLAWLDELDEGRRKVMDQGTRDAGRG